MTRAFLLKPRPLFLAAAGVFLLPLCSAQAQAHSPFSRRPASSLAKASGRVQAAPGQTTGAGERASWLFLLETRTQWLLVIREDAGSQASSSPEPSPGSPASAEGEEARALSQRSPFASSSTPRSRQATPGNEGVAAPETRGEPLVFEGNTDDVPWELPAKPQPKAGPSAPAS